jgi:cytochrome P450 family 135
MALPPGPSRPMLAQMAGWVMRPDAFLAGCQRRYGDTFTLRLLGFGEGGARPVVLTCDPAAIKLLFTAGPDVAPVGASRQSLAPMFGRRSVLLLDGKSHLRQRRLMLPPFHGDRMAAYCGLITQIAEEELERWPLGEPFPLQPRMQEITLEVILRVVFGVEDAERRGELRRRIKRLLDVVSNPLAELFMGLPARIGPLNLRADFERRVAEADELLLDEIAQRRVDPALAEREDILSLLLAARDEDGEAMTDAELRDQLVTLLLAGHETTATALAWTFEHLFRRLDAHERLVTEIRNGDGDDAFLDAVIQETLRLRPPIPVADRTLAAPLELNGHELPDGTVVAACIYLAHRRPDLYPNPDAFLPERFLDRAPETYGWVPFGGGIRRCLGAAFATFEMKSVLKTVLARADLRPASARAESIHRRAIVLAPRRGARAVLTGRARTSQLAVH